ncbi:hypothetical protein UFOVP504_12 [uncultured Caudovirales phage]|uniref:Uncharacterized protein n=1 Tax=uncultured Caudovirales phage TaxID=2100421 RepID=A0A6J5STK2_9CAUD|nr:hypothetical protein UFOVP504_12 [uncultured Caudovirales phage]CAB4178175.1 hypothetical protein UFOVP1011_38 [uncultured Caudovirales phage]CAB4187101.1 hypothetical protein UFOVP1162_26 [uncultured Caudovirales phage]CAB4218645.1 hypothetical protein UFOVP1611_29 [uncultured Caudovirales phage]
MPLPDNFDSRAYAAAYERPIIAVEPPLYAATRDDIDAMQKARAWLVVSLTSLRENPWEFDSTEIPPHHMLLADAEAFLAQMDKALEQARASLEAW